MINSLQNCKNIFLTDDDSDDCSLFSDALKEICGDAVLTITNDGVELMNVLDNTAKPPYVIFLDLNMPRKNGFECLKEIRNSSLLKKIPIIVLSTNSNEEYIEQSYTFGANYYICKPKSFALLKKAIAVVLSFDRLTLNIQPAKENFVLS